MKSCPGIYCGRYELSDGNLSECGACPRGWRTPPDSDICRQCLGDPIFYDWLYLIFTAAVPLFYHWYYIDNEVTNLALSRKLIFSAILESIISCSLTILLMSPMWEFKLNSCSIEALSDWYPFLYNPTPNYGETLYCSEEAAYPFYTMIYVFYLFGAISLLAIRLWFIDHSSADSKTVNDSKAAVATVYAGLHLYPILGVIHAIFCGFIYNIFPYIVIIGSVISIAVHFALKLDQSMSSLVKDTVTKSRNLFIVLIHWMCHAFGIIGITQLKEPVLHYLLLCLVPVPTIFYILTSRLTDPRKLHSD